MFGSARAKIASVLLATTAMVGVGVGMSGPAQAAGRSFVEGTWVYGYLGVYDYESPRPWDWSFAYNQCRGYHSNTISVKLIWVVDKGNDLFKYRFVCSSAGKP